MRKFQFALACLITLLCAYIGVGQAPQVADIVAGRIAMPLTMKDTIDADAAVRGLKRAPRFAETLRWWSGSWGAVKGDGEEIKFYRPATVTLWWLQLRLLGDASARGFLAIHVFWHLAVALLALLFLRRLAGLRVALLAMVIWTLHLCYIVFYLPAPIYALRYWKDDPDIMVTLCILASQLAFLSWTRDARRWHLVAALAWFALGICFKEQAYVTPFLLALLLWHERKLAAHWRALLPFVALAIIAFGFRYWALQGLGFRFGTNGSWVSRWFSECVGGAATAALNRYDGLPLALALMMFAAGAGWRWRHEAKRRAFYAVWFGALIAGATGALLVTDALQGLGWGATLSRVLVVFPWNGNFWVLTTLITAGLLWVFKLFVERRPRVQIYAYVWLLIAYAPLMTAPITQHALYLMSLGWALFFAVPLAKGLEAWKAWLLNVYISRPRAQFS